MGKLDGALFPLFLLLAVTAFRTYGVQISIDYEGLYPTSADPYGQLTCSVVSDFPIISVSVSSMKTSGLATELLTLTEDTPSEEIIFGDVTGNGILETNQTHAVLTLTMTSVTACLPVDFYVCQVKFTNKSGAVETLFAQVGPGTGNTPAPWTEQGKHQNSITTGNSVDTGSGSSVSMDELSFLGEKLMRLERKVDLLDERLARKIDRADEKLGAVETEQVKKVGSVETNLALRVKTLEDRLFGLVAMPGSVNEQRQDDIKKQIADIKAKLIQMNESLLSHGLKDQPTACERGMGNNVTINYPKYAILHDHRIHQDVLCDTQTDGGGWIVFQRRAFGDVDFYRDWTAYRDGFGSLTGDFWLGNEAVYQITDSGTYELRVDIRAAGDKFFASYSTFRLESEFDNYRLKIGRFNGSTSDSLREHHDQPFSTFDRDNDSSADRNCAVVNHGGWWYHLCNRLSINGRWGVASPGGSVWTLNRSTSPPTSFTEMKIRRVEV